MNLKAEILSEVDLETNTVWLPAKFRYLRTFNFSRMDFFYDSRFEVDIVLMEEYRKSSEELHFTAKGAVNLKIPMIASFGGTQIAVKDVKQDHLDGINYEIWEEENHEFSFSCEDFEIKIIKP